jgi:hypothetical protein
MERTDREQSSIYAAAWKIPPGGSYGSRFHLYSLSKVDIFRLSQNLGRFNPGRSTN